jgi:hypothetical protein
MRFTHDQMRLFHYLRGCESEFMVPARLGAAAGGLKRRSLIYTRHDHHKTLLARLAPLGLLVVEDLVKRGELT